MTLPQNLPQPTIPSNPCPVCNGESGHHKETSSTTGIWVPCPACALPDAPLSPQQLEIELDGPAAVAVWETAILFAANFMARNCVDGAMHERALTNMASPTLRAIADGLPAEVVYTGYWDENECSGDSIEDYLKNRIKADGMEAPQIGDEIDVDAVFTRTETWRIVDDVAFKAERVK